MIKPWRATCIQTINRTVNHTSNREDAMAIVNQSLDRWISFIGPIAGGSSKEIKNLVLFPEFNLTGFPLGETAEEWIEKACIEIPGPETQRLQEAAQKFGVYIGANAYERDPQWPGRYFNCCFLIDPSGDIILKYKRINTVHSPSPHDFMEKYFDHYGVEGAFPVVKTELGNIGMFPCGEIMYPEAARVLMMRGAEVILHPTSDHGPPEGVMGWEQCKRARAAENMVYLVSCNAGGSTGRGFENSNMGYSKIIDYNGRIIANTGGQGETSVSTLINVQELRTIRQEVGPLNRIARQRTEMYMRVYNDASFYPPNSFPDKPMGSKAEITQIMRDTMDRLGQRGVITQP